MAMISKFQFVFGVFFLFAACCTNNSVSAQEYDNESSIINVEGVLDNSPYSFIDKDGKPSGFSVELWEAIAQLAGIEYQITLLPLHQSSTVNDIPNVDLLISIAISEERQKRLSFSEVYMTIPYDILSLGGSGYDKIEKLADKRIVVKEGAIVHKSLYDLGPKYCNNIIFVNSINEGLELVINGDADAIIANRDNLRDEMLKKSYSNFDIHSSTLDPVGYCFASKNQQLISDVNYALLKVISNGTYDQIYYKWFNAQRNTYKKDYFELTLLILLILVIVVFYIVISTFRGKIKRTIERNRNMYLAAETLLTESSINIFMYDAKDDTLYFLMNGEFVKSKLSVDKLETTVHPDDKHRHNLQKSLLSCGKLNSLNNYQLRIYDPKMDSYVQCEYTIRVIDTYRDGRASKYLFSKKNITAQQEMVASNRVKNINAELEKSKLEIATKDERFRMMLNKLPVPIFVKDVSSGEYQFINEAAINTFHIDINGGDKSGLCLKDTQFNDNINKRIAKTGEDYAANENVELATGGHLETFVRKTLIDTDGQKQILIVRMDVTEQIKAQMTSKILANSLPALDAYTWYIDLRDGIINYEGVFSGKLSMVQSINTIEKFLGTIHPDDVQNCRNTINNIVNGNKSEGMFAFRIDFDCNGQYEWWESRVGVEVMSKDTVPYKYLYGININIDSQKRIELALQQSRQTLGEYNKQSEVILHNSESLLVYLNADYEVQWSNASYVWSGKFAQYYKEGQKCYNSFGLNEPCVDCPVVKSIEKQKLITLELNDKFEDFTV